MCLWKIKQDLENPDLNNRKVINKHDFREKTPNSFDVMLANGWAYT